MVFSDIWCYLGLFVNGDYTMGYHLQKNGIPAKILVLSRFWLDNRDEI